MSSQNKPAFESEVKRVAKQMRAQEAKRALTDYHAAAQAADANMLRLRNLRLAKEAADAAEAAAHPPSKPTPRTRAKTRRLSKS
jgi:hypothetical protein